MSSNHIFQVFQSEENEIEKIGRVLDRYGEVREIKLKNNAKLMAAKLIKKEREDFINETMYEEKRLYGIVKTNKIITKKINEEEYDLIIMEKALFRDLEKLNEFKHEYNLLIMEEVLLRDLEKLNKYEHKCNLLKLINEDIFDAIIGDNILRFFTKQILDSLENLDRNFLVHFDIKPENLLIILNLILKVSDFSLVTKLKDDDIINIHGDTFGYLTSEYYNKEKSSNDVVRKQDYIDLCSTIFYLKYGEYLLTNKNDDSSIDKEHIMEILFRKHRYIKGSQLTDPKFIDFLISLIQYNANEKVILEKIHRNKWLNKNKEIIEDIVHSNENDEEKIIMELQKSEHLINKVNDKKRKKFTFKKRKEKKI